jgi:pimeloyl-ACP methyl ester carboxylesterase
MARSAIVGVTVAVLSSTFVSGQSLAQGAKTADAHNVVLVHGAWADGSSWSQVILRLQAAGLHVTAVQNPLTSLADSVAATRRALALQDGSTVLVAHSWAGTVISEVGMDPKVTALVYVAARAPDTGEDFVALSGRFPTMPLRAALQEHDGFTTIAEDAFLKFFANGVPRDKAEVLYAVQEPTVSSLFSERTTAAAWRAKPSWYAVSTLDQTISPDLERFLAERMKATTVELEAGHLSLVSHPREIAELILAAGASNSLSYDRNRPFTGCHHEHRQRYLVELPVHSHLEVLARDIVERQRACRWHRSFSPEIAGE